MKKAHGSKKDKLKQQMKATYIANQTNEELYFIWEWNDEDKWEDDICAYNNKEAI